MKTTSFLIQHLDQCNLGHTDTKTLECLLVYINRSEGKKNSDTKWRMERRCQELP